MRYYDDLLGETNEAVNLNPDGIDAYKRKAAALIKLGRDDKSCRDVS